MSAMNDLLLQQIEEQTRILIGAAGVEAVRHQQIYGPNCVCPLCRAVAALAALLQDYDAAHPGSIPKDA
jgi:hypothetical protein